MKRLFIVSCLAILGSCGTGNRTMVVSNEVSPDRPEGLKSQIIDNNITAGGANSDSTIAANTVHTDSVKLKEILSFLASDALKGRESGSEGIETAAGFIETYFENNGVQTYFDSYRDTLSNYEVPSYNIVGLVPGKDRELAKQYIVIGAHYDHVGIISSATDDKIANGANDNASGTSTVMEIARYFGTHRTNKRSLLFVLFSAEEKGLLGSVHLSERLKNNQLDLYAMLNFEMTGVPMAGQDYLMYLTGYENSNLAALCNKYAGENLIGFLPQAKQYQLFQRSDNYAFHQVFGVPSQTYCTFDFTNYDYYHKVGDEAFRMDFGHMAEIVNKMIPVIEGLSNAGEREIKYN
ncbi:MAG: M28 family metallopeptidase [Flavobacteriaceae bacterium]